jgi:hypothetical protein
VTNQRAKLADSTEDRLSSVEHGENPEISRENPPGTVISPQAKHREQPGNDRHRNHGQAPAARVEGPHENRQRHLRLHESESQGDAACQRFPIGEDQGGHGERQGRQTELRQGPHASPAEKHQHRKQDHPERIVRPEESRGQIWRKKRHAQIQEQPDRKRDAHRKKAERREQDDAVGRVLDCRIGQLVDVLAINEPCSPPSHDCLQVCQATRLAGHDDSGRQIEDGKSSPEHQESTPRIGEQGSVRRAHRIETGSMSMATRRRMSGSAASAASTASRMAAR